MDNRQDYNIRIHQSIETLLIKDFDKILRENAYEFLLIGYKGFESVDWLPNNTLEVWEKIKDQFSENSENNENTARYVLRCEIDWLETRLTVATHVLEMVFTSNMSHERFVEYVKGLSKLGFTLHQNKPILEEVERFKRQIRSAKTKIKQKIEELKAITPINEDSKKSTIYHQKAKLERILGIKIDLNTCVCIEWLSYWSDFEEVVKMSRKKSA